jgi:isopenicillin N synthase-like dioxygenase
MSIPIIDLERFLNGGTSQRARIAVTLDHALRSNGFFLVQGHGLPNDLLESLQRLSREFFACPLDEKMKVAQPRSGIMRGYVAMGRESLSYSLDQDTPPDLNESFMIGQPYVPPTDRSFAPNLWPVHPPLMKAVWTEYYCQMEDLAGRLMRMFAVALHLPESFFDDKFEAHTSRLRARYYPSRSEPPRPGQLRAGAHTDYGSLAILAAEDRPGGLQVREQSGQWLDVPVIKDCFIVNIGDLTARWTNERWPAALHRVVNPPRPALDEAGRLSHIYFQSPNDDVVIECLDVCCGAGQPPKYSPVRAGEYLAKKFKKVDQSRSEVRT